MLKENVFAVSKEVEPKTVAARLRDALIGIAIVGLPMLIWLRWPKASAKPNPPVALAPNPQPQPPLAVAPPAFKSKFQPPAKGILFQPLFVWENAEPTMQGTGFFVSGEAVAWWQLPAPDFLPSEGPRLLEARWLDLFQDYSVVAVFKTTWGKPGREGFLSVDGANIIWEPGKSDNRASAAEQEMVCAAVSNTARVVMDERLATT